MQGERLVFVAAVWCCTAFGQLMPNRVEPRCTLELIQSLSLACSADEPCPVFLELAAADLVGTRIVLTGNLHTGSQTVESLLLISDDGGHTWSEAHTRIPGVVLDQIQFIDFEAGWINGHILQTTPKDAFFLLTTDGGKTWRRRAVMSESRTGAVDQFWFDSRTHGTLSLDRVRAAENGLRYELWESQTAGESWSVRQVDAKPVPFSPPVREPLLRIRNDSVAKVHRIERRTNNRWIPIASFFVSAGECKPPQAEAEPQAEAAKEALPPLEPANPPGSPNPPSRVKKPPSLTKPAR